MATPISVGNRSPRSGDDDACHFDFVFIENDLEGQVTDDEESYDDNSYDYCEDACCMLSQNNDDDDENGDDCYSLSEVTEDGTSSSPVTGLRDSVLTVPSVLMKDLDEAHEAAKLTRIADPEDAVDLEISPAGDNEETSEKQESHSSESENSSSNNDNDFIANDDPSSLVVSTAPTLEKPVNVVDKSPTARTIIIWSPGQNGNDASANKSTPCLVFSKVPEKDTTKKDKQPSTEENKKKNTSIAMSRTSNKKRRKQLKLLKKKQAASAATERIEQQTKLKKLSTSSQGKSCNKFLKKQLTPSRCGSKKVANIAVSCAIETMASYRDELSRQQEKQNKQVS